MSFIMLDFKCPDCDKVTESLVKADNGEIREEGVLFSCDCGAAITSDCRLLSSPSGIHMCASVGARDNSTFSHRTSANRNKR